MLGSWRQSVGEGRWQALAGVRLPRARWAAVRALPRGWCRTARLASACACPLALGQNVRVDLLAVRSRREPRHRTRRTQPHRKGSAISVVHSKRATPWENSGHAPLAKFQPKRTASPVSDAYHFAAGSCQRCVRCWREYLRQPAIRSPPGCRRGRTYTSGDPLTLRREAWRSSVTSREHADHL